MSELLAVVRIAAPDRRRFAGAIALGTLAALATVGLLACSGALIDRSALRPPLSTLTVLMAAVQLLALARGPLRYAERLTSHDAALSALGRVRLWLFDRMAPRSPAALAAWASGAGAALRPSLLAVLGAVFGAWASSMIGSSAPNSRLRAFEKDIEAGRLLLMVDVPRGRVEEIETLLQNAHPEARFAGLDPAVPAFP